MIQLSCPVSRGHTPEPYRPAADVADVHPAQLPGHQVAWAGPTFAQKPPYAIRRRGGGGSSSAATSAQGSGQARRPCLLTWRWLLQLSCHVSAGGPAHTRSADVAPTGPAQLQRQQGHRGKPRAPPADAAVAGPAQLPRQRGGPAKPPTRLLAVPLTWRCLVQLGCHVSSGQRRSLGAC